MKKILASLVCLLVLCQCKPAITNADIANQCVNYLLAHHQANYSKYTVSRTLGDDSSTIDVDISPNFDRLANTDSTLITARWILIINPATVIPYASDQFLVKFYDDDSEGTHYTAGGYLLVTVHDRQVTVNKRLSYSEDDLDLTIKKVKGEELIAQRITEKPIRPEDFTYFAVQIKGDSLLKVKQVLAKDTL